MTAATAAAYCDERSIDSFLGSVGTLYPEPITVPGKGKRWVKEVLDQAIDRLTGSVETVRDVADLMS
jgi:hypothetical protein